MRACAIILAAGRSRRMGGGVQKLLLPLAGTTLVGRVADALLDSEVDHVAAVVGPDRRVADALAGRPVTLVTSDDPEADMLASVRCGLRALPGDCDAVLVALGDQPAISSDLVNQMLRAFREGPAGIVVPIYEGRRGHPLLFSPRYRNEVLTGYDGKGLRGLLQSHPEDVLEMPTAQRWVVEDVDEPEDYRREVMRGVT